MIYCFLYPVIKTALCKIPLQKCINQSEEGNLTATSMKHEPHFTCGVPLRQHPGQPESLQVQVGTHQRPQSVSMWAEPTACSWPGTCRLLRPHLATVKHTALSYSEVGFHTGVGFTAVQLLCMMNVSAAKAVKYGSLLGPEWWKQWRSCNSLGWIHNFPKRWVMIH